MSDILKQNIKVDHILTLPGCVLPSPMEGIMRPVFCAAVQDLNLFPCWITPFFSISPGSVPACSFFREKLKPFYGSGPIIVQLSGHDAQTLAETAYRLAMLGISAININMACPSSTVISSGNGGALLKNLHLAEQIISQIRKNTSQLVSLSVKIRIGWQSEDEMENIAEFINGNDIPFVICHYRTVTEKYSVIPNGIQRLSRFRSLLRSDTVLFGNGDIQSISDGQNMIRKTNCQAIAIGRALISNPFLIKHFLNNFKMDIDENEKKGDVMRFLSQLLLVPERHPDLAGQWSTGHFLECCKLGLGVSSPLFQKLIQDSLPQIRDEFAALGYI